LKDSADEVEPKKKKRRPEKRGKSRATLSTTRERDDEGSEGENLLRRRECFG